VLSGLFTTFFLGGWLGLPGVPPEIWFLLKTTIVMLVMMLPRGFAPRVRLDMLIRTGWVKLLALAFANLFLTMVIVSLGIVHLGVA
jgi:NADH-quinone oxidoreductase subunit H